MQKPPKLGQTQKGIIAALLCLALAIGVFDGLSLRPPSPPTNNASAPERADKQNDRGRDVSKGMAADDWVALFTLGLIIVGGIQVRLFWVQLRLIGKSLIDAKIAANAAKEAADAAKVSAEHIPRVERAYLFACPCNFVANAGSRRTTYKFSIENAGKTPGFVSQIAIVQSLREPSGAPAYPNSRVLQTDMVVAAGATNHELDIDGEAPWTTMFFIYGFIIYTDIFKNGHTSRFCLEVTPTADPKTASIKLAGGREWNDWD